MSDQIIDYSPYYYETHGELIKRPYRVQLMWIGEGWSGDYQEDDPEDAPLLRFYVSRWNRKTREWDDLDDASYCTQMPINVSENIKRRMMEVLMREAHDGASKRTWEWLSWLCPSDFEDRQPAVQPSK